MDVTPIRTRGPVTVRFEDGLGQRHHADGNNGEPLEILVLRDRLAAAPGFKDALQQQLERLASFRHPSFGHTRTVARLVKSETAIAVISDRVGGVRLSDVLDTAGAQQYPVDMRTALWLTRQLVSAIAALHQHGADDFHGAIALERIIVTPDAKLVVVEHVLGPAMSRLRCSRSEYWTKYRIATPPATDGGVFDQPIFDQRTDVMQVGAVALALVLGHALGDDFPAHIGGTSEGTATLSAAAALELMPDDVRSWLSRALQIDSDDPFASAIEARDEFDRLLKGIDQVGCSDRFKALMAAHQGDDVTIAATAPPVAAPAATPPIAALTATPPIAARKEAPPETPHVTALPWPPPQPAVDDDGSTGSFEPRGMFGSPVEPNTTSRRLSFGRERVMAAAVILVVIASASAFAARRYFQAPPAPATGALVVNTNPTGARIAVDGQERGTSPLHLDLSPGNHVVDVISESGRRTIPVTIAAGSEVAQFIEVPQVAAAITGQLQIRTEPSGARITIDGQPHGVSPALIDGLAPGIHKVALEGALGSVVEDVTVQAGAIASVIVPLNGAQGMPVSGWVAVSAPAEVQLYEDGRLLGSSRTDRIMALVGKHDLELVNDALGFRATRSVNVAAGRVASIALDWPTGSIALNALPWANVWIDGQLVGETPVGNLSLPIGPHAVVFRHPELGEQRYDALVTLKGPARLSADLRKK